MPNDNNGLHGLACSCPDKEQLRHCSHFVFDNPVHLVFEVRLSDESPAVAAGPTARDHTQTQFGSRGMASKQPRVPPEILRVMAATAVLTFIALMLLFQAIR